MSYGHPQVFQDLIAEEFAVGFYHPGFVSYERSGQTSCVKLLPPQFIGYLDPAWFPTDESVISLAGPL